jgi:hypothetical protein
MPDLIRHFFLPRRDGLVKSFFNFHTNDSWYPNLFKNNVF